MKRKILPLKESSLPGLALMVILAAMLVTMFAYHHWTRSKPNERGVIKWDVISYYAYLPATFIYGDVTLEFLDDPPEGFVNDNKFWFFELENGSKLIQTSMGLSILYSPFFFTAHALAPLFGEARDGYGSIYQLFLVLSSLFYVMIGLLLLRKILLRYFSPVATAVTLVLVALGTNLFFYTVHEGPMSHAYNFTLITLFLFLVIRWFEKPVAKNAVWIGLVYGMIVLVRPTNVITGVLILLWGVTGWSSFRDRIRFLFLKWPQVAMMVGCFILPWIPQMVYWKTVTGSFLFNSYGPSGSSFYFGSPHIIDVLFSYRKGWYLYTPVMLVATAGIFFMGKSCRQGWLAILLYLILQVYLQASWWSWWNGGSFGLRSFVDIYGIMAIPLAALVEAAVKARRGVTVTAGLALLFLLYMNQYQTFQYNRGVIHHTGMTKEAYWLNFLAFRGDGSSWQMLAIPDAELARKGIYYEYYTGDDHEALRNMEPSSAMDSVRREVESDKKLVKEIRKHASREEIPYAEALEMVVERVYDQKVSPG